MIVFSSLLLLLVGAAVLLPVVISVVVVDHVIIGTKAHVTPDLGMIDASSWLEQALHIPPLAAACLLFGLLQIGWAFTGHYHRLTLIRAVINGLRDLNISRTTAAAVGVSV